MLFEYIFVSNSLQVSSTLRIAILRLFGARIGHNVIMRPRIRVKFPWNLTIGNNSWIGEGVWVHNQAMVKIEDNVVISQETFITTGSHEAQQTMDLLVRPITICSGVWITSRCIVLQGVEIGTNCLITPGSVVHQSLPPDGMWGGNPLGFIKSRWREVN